MPASGIDTSAADAMPSVVRAVGFGADLRRRAVDGVSLRDHQPVTATDRVAMSALSSHDGLAVDEATAFRAAEAIKVDYSATAAGARPEYRRMHSRRGAVTLFDEPTRGIALPVGKGCTSVADPAPNVLYACSFGHGDTDRWLDQSAKVFTDSFAITRINPFFSSP